jgi:class 3 adenylate cyclase
MSPGLPQAATTAEFPCRHRERARRSPSFITDLVDSSRSAGLSTPEALWNLLTRYFEAMTAVVQKHGGTVEKYIGDAIMAVSGFPLSTRTTPCARFERLLRCANTLASLNHDLQSTWDVQLTSRTGVNRPAR